MVTKIIVCIACVCVPSFFLNWFMTAAFLLRYKVLISRLRRTNPKINRSIVGCRDERKWLFHLLFRGECLNENLSVREFRLSVRRYATLYVCNNVICCGSGFLLMGIGCAMAASNLVWQSSFDKNLCKVASGSFMVVFLIAWGLLMVKFVSFEFRVLRLLNRIGKIKQRLHR